MSLESAKNFQRIFPYIQENIPIADNTYYKMGGIARYFAVPKNISEVQQSLFFCKERLLPCAILGSGSNSVYADGEFTGLIVSLEKLNAWHWETAECLFVEAGVTNTEVAEICAAANRAGASWMYRMPGQIGATVRMNARCYGGEISQIVQEIIAFNPNTQLVTYKAEEIFQGYKKTLLMDIPHIVVGVRLYFPKILPAKKIIQHMHECEADRHSKKHFYLPSCGSTFKNNYAIGKPSGKIFEELNLKGKQIGDAEVSEFHANFVWNKGLARTDDMLNLAAYMRAEARRALNADLELEVQPVGCFTQSIFTRCGMENLGPHFLNYKVKQSPQAAESSRGLAGESHENCLNPIVKTTHDENTLWVGLFSHPSEKKNNMISFPQTLFSSPFFEYHQTPLAGALPIIVNLVQLQPLKDAQKNPLSPFLKWETQCFDEVNKLFPLKCIDKAGEKNLWHYSVSEIFFAEQNNSSCYLEFEVTPDKNWIALQFAGIRSRSKENFNSAIETFSHPNKKAKKPDISPSFGMVFSYANLQYVLKESQSVLMQCALSLGNKRYLLAPYWKQENDEKKSPDFHQPHRFFWLNIF